GPATLAVVLSSLAFNYYFTEPIHTFYVNRTDLGYYIVFVAFAVLVTWFSTIRRRFERQLILSREELRNAVAIRTRPAGLLDLTHDSVLVRARGDRISYWNGGAQELYGFTAQEAIGKIS